MAAQQIRRLIRISEWERDRYRRAAANARMQGDDRTAVQFDNMAGYFVWRVELLELVIKGQRLRMPTFREWLATPAAVAAGKAFQATFFQAQ